MSSRNLCPHRRTKPLDEPMRMIQWCFCFESKEGKTPLDQIKCALSRAQSPQLLSACDLTLKIFLVALIAVSDSMRPQLSPCVDFGGAGQWRSSLKELKSWPPWQLFLVLTRHIHTCRIVCHSLTCIRQRKCFLPPPELCGLKQGKVILGRSQPWILWPVDQQLLQGEHWSHSRVHTTSRPSFSHPSQINERSSYVGEP